MIARLGTIPLVAILGIALVNPSTRRDEPAGRGTVVDDSWTSRGFAERLKSAAESARAELRKAPEVESADIRVRSAGEHEPLKVEASVAWTAGAESIPAERRAELLSKVRAWFDSFACVEVVTK
jgi:hypothetical protein